MTNTILMFSAAYLAKKIKLFVLHTSRTTDSVSKFMSSWQFWRLPLLLFLAGSILAVLNFAQSDEWVVPQHWRGLAAIFCFCTPALVLISTRLDHLINLMSEEPANNKADRVRGQREESMERDGQEVESYSLQRNLRQMERSRESYWAYNPKTSSIKLRWRASTVRHCLHVVPGESILEIGAGTGLWTSHLAAVFNGESSVTAAVFNQDFYKIASARRLPNTRFVQSADLNTDFDEESFDCIIGTAILCHNLYSENLSLIYRLLKPGGRLLFFEANFWNPQVFLKSVVPLISRWTGQARCQRGMRKHNLIYAASHVGFTNIEVIPYDIVHSLTPSFLIPLVRSAALILEHTPVIRQFCGTLYIWARKPGNAKEVGPRASLAKHKSLFSSVSVVVPCYNEETNVSSLIQTLLDLYGEYIREIVIVNDNSTDQTAEVTRSMALKDNRVRLVDRQPPNGVGRALREGYAASKGSYILSMDCDFVQIAPELRDLFNAIAAGRDGAIGSRFSHESVLINYPLLKILCNRSFHLLANLLFRRHMHDISNNLKLYRAYILKELSIEEDHFAANVETGLKPLLAGYDIQELPISWINRTLDMGSSSFKILRVAPHYFLALVRIAWRSRLGRRV